MATEAVWWDVPVLLHPHTEALAALLIPDGGDAARNMGQNGSAQPMQQQPTQQQQQSGSPAFYRNAEAPKGDMCIIPPAPLALRDQTRQLQQQKRAKQRQHVTPELTPGRFQLPPDLQQTLQSDDGRRSWTLVGENADHPKPSLATSHRRERDGGVVVPVRMMASLIIREGGTPLPLQPQLATGPVGAGGAGSGTIDAGEGAAGRFQQRAAPWQSAAAHAQPMHGSAALRGLDAARVQRGGPARYGAARQLLPAEGRRESTGPVPSGGAVAGAATEDNATPMAVEELHQEAGVAVLHRVGLHRPGAPGPPGLHVGSDPPLELSMGPGPASPPAFASDRAASSGPSHQQGDLEWDLDVGTAREQELPPPMPRPSFHAQPLQLRSSQHQQHDHPHYREQQEQKSLQERPGQPMRAQRTRGLRATTGGCARSVDLLLFGEEGAGARIDQGQQDEELEEEEQQQQQEEEEEGDDGGMLIDVGTGDRAAEAEGALLPSLDRPTPAEGTSGTAAAGWEKALRELSLRGRGREETARRVKAADGGLLIEDPFALSSAAIEVRAVDGGRGASGEGPRPQWQRPPVQALRGASADMAGVDTAAVAGLALRGAEGSGGGGREQDMDMELRSGASSPGAGMAVGPRPDVDGGAGEDGFEADDEGDAGAREERTRAAYRLTGRSARWRPLPGLAASPPWAPAPQPTSLASPTSPPAPPRLGLASFSSLALALPREVPLDPRGPWTPRFDTRDVPGGQAAANADVTVAARGALRGVTAGSPSTGVLQPMLGRGAESGPGLGPGLGGDASAALEEVLKLKCSLRRAVQGGNAQAVGLILSLLAALPASPQLLADSQVAALVSPLQYAGHSEVAAAARRLIDGWKAVLKAAARRPPAAPIAAPGQVPGSRGFGPPPRQDDHGQDLSLAPGELLAAPEAAMAVDDDPAAAVAADPLVSGPRRILHHPVTMAIHQQQQQVQQQEPDCNRDIDIDLDPQVRDPDPDPDPNPEATHQTNAAGTSGTYRQQPHQQSHRRQGSAHSHDRTGPGTVVVPHELGLGLPALSLVRSQSGVAAEGFAAVFAASAAAATPAQDLHIGTGAPSGSTTPAAAQLGSGHQPGGNGGSTAAGQAAADPRRPRSGLQVRVHLAPLPAPAGPAAPATQAPCEHPPGGEESGCGRGQVGGGAAAKAVTEQAGMSLGVRGPASGVAARTNTPPEPRAVSIVEGCSSGDDTRQEGAGSRRAAPEMTERLAAIMGHRGPRLVLAAGGERGSGGSGAVSCSSQPYSSLPTPALAEAIFAAAPPTPAPGPAHGPAPLVTPLAVPLLPCRNPSAVVVDMVPPLSNLTQPPPPAPPCARSPPSGLALAQARSPIGPAAAVPPGATLLPPGPGPVAGSSTVALQQSPPPPGRKRKVERPISRRRSVNPSKRPAASVVRGQLAAGAGWIHPGLPGLGLADKEASGAASDDARYAPLQGGQVAGVKTAARSSLVGMHPPVSKRQRHHAGASGSGAPHGGGGGSTAQVRRVSLLLSSLDLGRAGTGGEDDGDGDGDGEGDGKAPPAALSDRLVSAAVLVGPAGGADADADADMGSDDDAAAMVTSDNDMLQGRLRAGGGVQGVGVQGAGSGGDGGVQRETATVPVPRGVAGLGMETSPPLGTRAPWGGGSSSGVHPAVGGGAAGAPVSALAVGATVGAGVYGVAGGAGKN